MCLWYVLMNIIRSIICTYYVHTYYRYSSRKNFLNYHENDLIFSHKSWFSIPNLPFPGSNHIQLFTHIEIFFLVLYSSNQLIYTRKKNSNHSERFKIWTNLLNTRKQKSQLESITSQVFSFQKLIISKFGVGL